MLEVTVILQDCLVIIKSIDDAPIQKFPSHEEAKEHVERLIALRLREGGQLVATREVEDQSTEGLLGGQAGVTVSVEFDHPRSRLTLKFKGDFPTTISEEAWVKPLSTQTLAQSRARMERDKPRCVHVFCDWATPGPQLAKMLYPGLEALIFDTPYETKARQSLNSVGDIAEILRACPKLQRAFITGCSAMNKTRHEQLRELYLLGEPLKFSVLTALAESEFPALETLAIDTGSDRDGACARLVRTLRSIRAPRLAQVYILGVEMVEFLSSVGSAPLPWRLFYCGYGEDDIEGLLETLDACPALRECGLTLDLDDIPFESEIAQVEEKGATFADVMWRFRSDVYQQW
jgi:hypothetical protein